MGAMDIKHLVGFALPVVERDLGGGDGNYPYRRRSGGGGGVGGEEEDNDDRSGLSALYYCHHYYDDYYYYYYHYPTCEDIRFVGYQCLCHGAPITMTHYHHIGSIDFEGVLSLLKDDDMIQA